MFPSVPMTPSRLASIVIAATLTVALPQSAGALEPAVPSLESCSVEWEALNDGADSHEITVTILGSAPKFALVLDTAHRGIVPVDYLGRTTAGVTTVVKVNHDNDYDYLSARPVANDGTKGDWVNCGNTGTSGPAIAPDTRQTSVCGIADGVATVTNVQDALRIETLTADDQWTAVDTRTATSGMTFTLAELGLDADASVRVVDIQRGFPDRPADSPAACEPVDPDAVAFPATSCTSPTFYLGPNERPIIGSKVLAAIPDDPRVNPKQFVFRVLDGAGATVSGVTTESRPQPDRSMSGKVKVKDIAPGTYEIRVRYIARPIDALGLPRPKADWMSCGAVEVIR